MRHQRLHRVTLASGILAAFTGLSLRPASAQVVYSTLDINPAGWYSSYGDAASTTMQFGFGVPTSDGVSTAVAWSGSSGSALPLAPTNESGGTPIYSESIINAVAGGQEGGWAYNPITQITDAAIWTGTSTTITDIGPAMIGGTASTGSSIFGMAADGTSTGIQVGQGEDSAFNTHGLVWFGTAASAIDLNTSMVNGEVLSTSNAEAVSPTDVVVGSGANGAENLGQTTALAWVINPTTKSIVSTTVLDQENTTSNVYSTGNAIFGNVVVGSTGDTSGNSYAALWNISNLSSVKYTSLATVLGNSFSQSSATGISGTNIVGSAENSLAVYHAILWYGAGDSQFVDLSTYLPTAPDGGTWKNSFATAISSNGVVVGEAYDMVGTTSTPYAVFWKVSTVPAPSALPVMAGGLSLVAGLLARRRRRP